MGGIFSFSAKSLLSTLKEQKETQALKSLIQEKQLECLMQKKRLQLIFYQKGDFLFVKMIDPIVTKEFEKKFKYLKINGSESISVLIEPPFYRLSKPIEVIGASQQKIRI